MRLGHGTGEISGKSKSTAQFAEIGGQHGQDRTGPAQFAGVGHPGHLGGIAGGNEEQQVGDPVGQLVPDRPIGAAAAVLDGHHPVEQVAHQAQLDARRGRQQGPDPRVALHHAGLEQVQGAGHGQGDAAEGYDVGADA